MEQVSERAARWGIDPDYWDAFGRRRIVDAEVLTRLLDAMAATGEPAPRMLPPAIVVRGGGEHTLRLDATGRVRWEIISGKTRAVGESDAPVLPLPGDLPIGSYRLRVNVGDLSEESCLLVTPSRAWQGDGGRRWALAVQLYGVRSHRNWGHGDFTDLAGLIDLAAGLGAAGIGLNPLHALFDDRPEEASPYSPNSRLFLNPFYIDIEAIPEFPGLARAGLSDDVNALRDAERVDYAGVARAKQRALTLAYEAYRQHASKRRQHDFARFRRERGAPLARFAAFEVLRRRHGLPWWNWPEEWRRPDDIALAQLRAAEPEAIEYHEFVQWLADRQLGACRDRAKQLGLPVGLYLDIAVGVRPDGFDAWSDQDFYIPSLEVGAPPDLLNLEGQRWGLAGIAPQGLTRGHFEPFRNLLRGSMRYAGAVRLDHVLGLKRLYLIPNGLRGDQGAYVQFPFEALLAVVAQESVAHQCIVIGEDLGTVPENFRETLADWGIWSYQVMMFERARDGGFISPDHYREHALVTFSTHDLPTLAGWRSGHDLRVKRSLGMDPGETDQDRAAAHEALGRALRARGLEHFDLASITRFLAATPSRLLVVSMEDTLGVTDQVNVPGTVNEHPNWRQRLPVALEHLAGHEGLTAVADIMAGASRAFTTPAKS